MIKFHFIPIVDIPLTIGMLVLFLFYYQWWAKSASEEVEVDLLTRLPQARFRTTLFFVAVLTICSLANFGVWAFMLLFIALGLVGSIITGSHTPSADFMFAATAVAVREWSFGFPSLILDLPKRDSVTPTTNNHELIGVSGITSGPLRPSGYARINDTEMAVIADCGTLIDAGVEVTVTGFRNGTLRVRLAGVASQADDGYGLGN